MWAFLTLKTTWILFLIMMSHFEVACDSGRALGVDVVTICTMGLFWDTVAYCIRGLLGWLVGTRRSAIGQFFFPLPCNIPRSRCES